jgi:hypothetical protein
MRLGFTRPALLDPAAAAGAAGAAFLLLGPAAAPSALRFGAEDIAVRLRLRLGTEDFSEAMLALEAAAAELQTSLESAAAVVLATEGTVGVTPRLRGASSTCT